FRYKFNYFIDKGDYWSLGVNSSLNQFDDDVKFNFIEEVPETGFNLNKIQVHYFDLTNQIYVETFFWDAFRFGLGFEHKYTQMKTETIADPEDSEDPNPKTILEKSHTFGPYGYLEYDSYDNTYFPDNGFYFRGD